MEQYVGLAAVLIVIALAIGVFFINQHQVKAVKVEKPKKTPVSYSTTSASESEGPSSSKPKKKRRSKASTQGKVIAPVGTMDEVTVESEEEEEIQPVKSEAPNKRKAKKPQQSAEEKVVQELLEEEKKLKEKKNNSKKPVKGASTQSNGKTVKEVVVVKMEDANASDNESDDENNTAIFRNSKRAAAFEILQSGNAYEGWAVVENNRRSKVKKADSPAADETVLLSTTQSVPEETVANNAAEDVDADATTAIGNHTPSNVVVIEEEKAPVVTVPVIETVTQELIVDAKKLGVLIGVKGETRIKISKATETTIQMPKVDKTTQGNVTITVNGPVANVARAIDAMNDMMTKGYSKLIAGEDFIESDVAVLPK
jgi:hypothetical protein